MSTDSLGRAGLNRRVTAPALASDHGVFRSAFFAPTHAGADALFADPLTAQWDALARHVTATPFLRPQWTLPWWRAFSEAGDELALWYLRRNGRIAALLPMVHRAGTMHVAANAYTPLSGILAESAHDAETLLGGILRSTEAREVVLPALDSMSTDPDICRRCAAASGHNLVKLPHERAGFLALDGGWKAYELQLSRDTKRDVRRRRQSLENIGALGFDVNDGRQRLSGLLDCAFGTEASGWNAHGRTALRSDARVESFYADIARWAATEGWLRLCFLRVDGYAVAMHLNLEHRGTWYLLAGSHDAEFRHLGPDKVLQYECIRHCFASGMGRIEFCGASTELSQRWSPHWRMLERLHLFPASTLGHLARLRVAARPWLRSWGLRLNLLSNSSSS